MSHHPTDFEGSVLDALKKAILASLPDAEVEASGGGGHFSLRVTSTAFAGKGKLESHRMVLSAIAPLMKGDLAPVHAIDTLITRTP